MYTFADDCFQSHVFLGCVILSGAYSASRSENRGKVKNGNIYFHALGCCEWQKIEKQSSKES